MNYNTKYKIAKQTPRRSETLQSPVHNDLLVWT